MKASLRILYFVASASRRPVAKTVEKALQPTLQEFNCEICYATLHSQEALDRHKSLHTKSWWPATSPQRLKSEIHPQNSFSDSANCMDLLAKPIQKATSNSVTPTQFQLQSPPKRNNQFQTDSSVRDLCKVTSSPKNVPKSQQKLYSCTFCFSPLETEKMLNMHLAEFHNFDGSVSQNSQSQGQDKCVKLEPGTSPPDEKIARKLKYKCSKCSYKNYFQEVKQHQRTVHSECEYMCDYLLCTYLFTTPNGLRKHMLKSHDEPNPFVCEICEQIFFLQESLDEHTCGRSPISKGKSHICRYKCGYRAPSDWDVKRHAKKHCVLNPDIIVKCRQCKVEIPQGDFQQHKEDHHKQELVNTRRNLRQRNANGKVA